MAQHLAESNSRTLARSIHHCDASLRWHVMRSMDVLCSSCRTEVAGGGVMQWLE
jgi:hypothetical protein